MDTVLQLGPEAHWRAALEEGRILLQRDPVTGTHYFPPRLAGPEGQPLDWVEASGTGTIYSATQIHPRAPQEPYNVVLVELDEGVRMMSRVDGVDAADLAIGTAVRARIARVNGEALIVFHRA